MSEILRGLSGVVCMMDDILIHGKTREEHDKHLQEVLERLQKTGVTLNKDKYEFAKSRIKFLGLVIDSDGIHPDPDRVTAITKVRPPQNVGDVCRFLGMVNQMGKFCPNLADITKPLRELLVKDNCGCGTVPNREYLNRQN